MVTFSKFTLWAIAYSALCACTYVPFENTRTQEKALPIAETRISEGLDNLLGDVGENAVVMAPLVDGNDALAARLRLIENADRSIDIKTFLIKPDIAGTLLWLQLYDAAERGVKIRLLYDDVFTSANDSQIATLDAHPNVEIRTFNPLSRNSTTVANFLLDFQRVNRRMHNKAIVVDGVLAIVGGRNVADEYYQIETSNEFADFDLLIGGPPIEDLSAAFDLYWNDPWAVPIQNFTKGDDQELERALQQFQANKASDEVEIYRKAMDSDYVNDLKAGRLERFRGTAEVVVDDPKKLRTPPGQGPFVVGNKFYNTLLAAEDEILIFTPYFVPEDYGAEVFEKLSRRGVRVRLVTNSLAATNHAYVHGGYKPYRDRLLSAGVEVLEVRADAPKIVSGADTPLVLHTKLAIVDQETLFVGSTNIDPRSIRQNSEVGMVIQSPSLAKSIQKRFDRVVDDYVFKVGKAETGSLNWVYSNTQRSEVFMSEPDATLWSKIVSKLAEWLPVESQL